MAEPESDISDWPRANYEPSERTAELFFIVVGPAPQQPLPISRKRHHISQIPPGLGVSTHNRGEAPDWFAGWFSDPLGAQIDALFLHPAEVRAAEQLTIVRGSFPDPPDLNYLRNTIGVISAIVDTPGTQAIFDAQALSWWRPSDWRAAFVDKSAFYIDDHIRIVITEDERYQPGLWAHTRGMIKFARPEVQIKHIPGPYGANSALVRAAGRVVRDVADYLARGAIIRDQRVLRDHLTQSPVIFRETPDDSQTTRHFNNAALEICDFDESTAMALQGARRLLEESERAHRSEE